MSVLIEDSPRNLALWIADAATRRIATGGVISPFETPWVAKQHRRGARDMADQIRLGSGDVWFDATTHALQMAGVGDFRYYDEYDLWSGSRNDLSMSAARRDHVQRVFALQDTLGARHLGPTLLLHHGESETSQRALDLARDAVERDPDCWISVAGTPPFWACGGALDAHIGALAQLEPTGWFLTVTRPLGSLPVDADAEEVYGLCRTVRALTEYAPIHVSHGDLAAMPAIAAGATSVGSGWDQRQRVCAYSNFASRDSGGDGGGWYERPTLRALMGSLGKNEAEVLVRRDPERANRIGPLPAPGPREAYLHHVSVLAAMVQELTSQSDFRTRYEMLADLYHAAREEWPEVVQLTGSSLDEKNWIGPLALGLDRYATSEGWPMRH